MPQLTVTITIDDETGITGREIGKWIQRCTSHTDQPLEVTATTTHIDIRFEKVYSEIAITGPLYERLKKASVKNHLTIDQMLEAGAKRYGEKT